jgi:isoleucyl-tRNA synthetase
LVEEIIKAETNVKEIEMLAADNDFIRRKAKANFKSLGKKLGAKMKWAADEIAKFDNAIIDKVLENNYLINNDYESKGELPIYINAEDLEVSTDEIPGFEVANKGSLTVALDITITDSLKKEGEARELVNRIQTIRKESGFNLSDRIIVKVSANEGLQASFTEYKTYICGEILADSLEFLPQINDGNAIEINESIVNVNVIKKGA